jgi:Mycobacterium membrane protein
MMRHWLWTVLKRHWALIVAVLVVTIVAFTVARLHGIFGSHYQTSRPGSEALENTNFDPKHVMLEVFGTPGSTATINYLDPKAQPQRVDHAPLPWSLQLTTTDPTMFADLRAQGTGNTVGCRITVDGVVKDERIVNIVNAYTSCLDKSA